jgi:GTP-binding protein
VPDGFPGRVEFVKSASKLAEAPHQVEPEVCFCGRSNVGKSSLLNVLTNRNRIARVSSTPGRTQLINFFNVQDRVTFVDLPGFGWARVPKAIQASWGRMIQGYLESRQQLCLALLLVDIRRTPGDDERGLLAWFEERGLPCLIVATKADKIKRSQTSKALSDIAESLDVPRSDVIPFSAPSRAGREAVWGSIMAHVEQVAPTVEA